MPTLLFAKLLSELNAGIFSNVKSMSGMGDVQVTTELLEQLTEPLAQFFVSISIFSCLLYMV